LIAGAPKEGKSWLALQIHCYLADNGLQSLYIGFEDNDQRLHGRFKSLPCQAHKNALFLAGINEDGLAFPRGAEALEALKKLKASYPALACIILDTVASIRQVSRHEKSYEFTVEEWSSLRSLAHHLGIALIAVHHTRKSNQSDNSPLERVLGSQGIPATAETCMVLTARTGSRDKNLFVTGKDVEQQELVLKWTDPGFQIVHDDPSYGLPRKQREVLNAIASHPRCTQATIAAVLEMDKSQLSHIVSKLIELGRIKRIDDGMLIATQP
jgi:DNA-binding MarR family transcriptional regulator